MRLDSKRIARLVAGIVGLCIAALAVMLPAVAHAQEREPQTGLHYFAIEQLKPGQSSGSIVRRGTAGSNGTAYSNLILAPNTRYRQWLLQAATLNVGFYEFTTPGNGQTLSLPPILLFPSTSLDTDGDGLHNEGELIMGTNPNDVDSDGDGVPDGAEVRQSTNPLDGKPAATGIIASVDTPGAAVDVCAVDDIAAVADSGSGVSVVDIQSVANPIIIAQVDTPGSAAAVACAGDVIAVADGAAGLAVIDVSDPPAAQIIHQVLLGSAAQAVVTGGGIAFVGLTSGTVAELDMASGALLGQLDFTEAIHDLALAGDRLYVLTTHELHAVFVEDLSVDGSAISLGSSPGRRRLFVGGDVAYTAHSRGYNTFDISAPGAPVLIATGFTPQLGWKQIVPNGSGLGVAAVGVNPNPSPANVSLYDVSDASLTNEFITTFFTPGNATAVSIHNGLAYVADGASGLQIINYLAYDALDVPPTLSLSTNFVPGQAEEGQVMRVTAGVSDDVQVRNVEFFVDGVPVATDGNFAFEHRFVTPLIAQQPSFTLSAQATDTGGNATSTVETVITLTTDATPPRASRVSPENGSIVHADTTRAISATFSEPIDPATLSDATFRLFSAGPDGAAGSADDVLVTGGIVSYRDDINTAFLTLGTLLPPDSYSAELSPAITDIAGNALPADVVWTFDITVTPIVDLYSISPRDDKLRIVDPDTAQTLSSVTIVLSGTTVEGGTGLATNPLTGELWAMLKLADPGPNSRELVTIDPVTGEATRIGNTGDRFAGLGFDSDGTLYGVTGDHADTPETLFTLSLTDATPTFVLALDQGFDGEAIAFNPQDGLIYHASGFSCENTFESIDPDTLAIDVILDLACTDYETTTALTHWEGDILLLADLVRVFGEDRSHDLFQITTAGVVTPIRAMDHTSKGLAFAPRRSSGP